MLINSAVPHLLKRPLLDSAAKSTAAVLAAAANNNNLQHQQRAAAHTDIVFPNFDAYRHDERKDPTRKLTEEDVDKRRGTLHAVFYGIGGIMSVIAAKTVATTVVQYKSMPADQQAMAAVEINLEEVPEGRTKTFEWRGKPVFVKHRTKTEIDRERAVDVASLRHPEKDEQRVKRPEWSILIGVCTHLGCIPIANSGDFGGYFCPCHGSHYDASGRIRKGPAPLNMEVPEYEFVTDTRVRVGKE